MKAVRINFTIPEEVVAMLKARVGERGRSAFVGSAIRDKLRQLEEEELTRTLIEGYVDRREEDIEIDKEWEVPTLEHWA